MASAPLSPAHLMSLGMFVFGMDTAAYTDFQRRMAWRHEQNDRFMARPASQYVGPGEDAITLAGVVVPELAGSYGAIDMLIDMADNGDNWPLMDGLGRVLGFYRIDAMEHTHHTVLAGGIPRAIGFSIDLKRVR